MSENFDELYQEVILDHSRSPRNFRKLEGANRQEEGYNPLCGDKVQVYLLLENDVIRDISFVGSGCAISKASASIMTASLKGKTATEAKTLFDQFRLMVTTGETHSEQIGKLAAFAGVHNFPARVKCAILPWHAILAALDGKTEPVTTES